MPVYVLREGELNHFKVGFTTGSVEGVVKRLRTGNPRPLTVFAIVETDQESACEAFFHRLLRERRVVWGGGREFFELEPLEMQSLIEETKRMFQEVREMQETLCELKVIQSNTTILEPSDDDTEILGRLLQIEKEQELLKIECELLRGRLMKRIGATAGIRGIATWKTQTKRMYSEELFRNSDPERYETLLEQYYCLDTQTWKKDKPDDYKEVQTTYFTPQTTRVFKLQQID